MEPKTPSEEQRRRDAMFAAAAVVFAAVSMVIPVVAFPALVAVVIASAALGGRPRLVAALVGGAFVLVGTARFTVEIAVPNIVSAGQRSSEERAVSRLREVLWAQDQHKARSGGYADLSSLVGPFLKEQQYRAVDAPGGPPQPFRAEGYLYRVYLAPPGSTSWIGYAWPAETGKGGRRAFFIDEREHICESSNAGGYSGVDNMPAFDAALQGGAFDAPRCGDGQDGSEWKPWRRKKPRVMP